MGTLPGWWLGEKEGRLNGPTLSEAQWNEELLASGFEGLAAACRDSSEADLYMHSVLVSRKSCSNTTYIQKNRDKEIKKVQTPQVYLTTDQAISHGRKDSRNQFVHINVLTVHSCGSGFYEGSGYVASSPTNSSFSVGDAIIFVSAGDRVSACMTADLSRVIPAPRHIGLQDLATFPTSSLHALTALKHAEAGDKVLLASSGALQDLVLVQCALQMELNLCIWIDADTDHSDWTAFAHLMFEKLESVIFEVPSGFDRIIDLRTTESILNMSINPTLLTDHGYWVSTVLSYNRSKLRLLSTQTMLTVDCSDLLEAPLQHLCGPLIDMLCQNTILLPQIDVCSEGSSRAIHIFPSPQLNLHYQREKQQQLRGSASNSEEDDVLLPVCASVAALKRVLRAHSFRFADDDDGIEKMTKIVRHAVQDRRAAQESSCGGPADEKSVLSGSDLRAALSECDESSACQILTHAFCSALAAILGLSPDNQIDAGSRMSRYGIDSLISIALKSWIRSGTFLPDFKSTETFFFQ